MKLSCWYDSIISFSVHQWPWTPTMKINNCHSKYKASIWMGTIMGTILELAVSSSSYLGRVFFGGGGWLPSGPRFLTRPFPPNWVLSPNISKISPNFSLNFDYFLPQNCIRKPFFLCFNTKICSNFAAGGIFGLSGQFFQVPPHLPPSPMWAPGPPMCYMYVHVRNRSWNTPKFGQKLWLWHCHQLVYCSMCQDPFFTTKEHFMKFGCNFLICLYQGL